jgi:hypothetical protein
MRKLMRQHERRHRKRIVSLPFLEVGIFLGQLHRLQGASAVLPSIASLLVHLPEEDDEISLAVSERVDEESISDAQELQNLIDGEEDINISRTQRQNSQMLTLTCAALAITADEMMNVEVRFLSINHNSGSPYSFYF